MTSLHKRWQDLEDLMDEHPNEVLTDPRWKRDNLKGYSGDKPQPTMDTPVEQKPEK